MDRSAQGGDGDKAATEAAGDISVGRDRRRIRSAVDFRVSYF